MVRNDNLALTGLIATMKLKEVTAPDLFRRLDSYSKQHALYRALKAFGQVPKSLIHPPSHRRSCAEPSHRKATGRD
jgi:TnpA family transposase